MSEFSLIYQAPILLTQKQIKRTEDSSLRYARKVTSYMFNAETKNYDVKNSVPAQNNQSKYRLLQFHSHVSAEFQFEDRKDQPYALEFHFVFEEASGSGNLLVMAFLFKKAACSSSIIRQIVEEESFLIPQLEAMWATPGSLTDLPGPNEHTIEWIISDKVLNVSEEDLALLTPKSKAARPIQPREGRDIIFVRPRSKEAEKKPSDLRLCHWF